jgi:putative peptide zinc metalloprotease protein
MAQLREVFGGLSRRTIAIALGVVLAAAGGLAGYASTGGFAPAADGSTTGASEPPSEATGSFAAAASAGVPPSAEPAASPSPTATADEAVVAFSEGIGPGGGGGGGNNAVNAHNEEDGRLRIKASIQLNNITAPTVGSRNSARAWSSCVDCTTLAVAMQINLIDRNARRVVPQNAAIAINYACSSCRTVALSYQYVLSVDDPRETPRDVEELVRTMDRELRRAARDDDLAAAIARIDAVIADFHELAAGLSEERDEATEQMTPGAVDETPPPEPAGPSGTPAASGSSDASASPAVTESPSPSPSPEASPAASPTDGASPAP